MITQNLKKYNEACEELWNIFTHFYNIENDWDLCDFHEDLMHEIFNLTIRRRFGLKNGVSSSHFIHRNPVDNLLISATAPEVPCWISASYQNWQKHIIQDLTSPLLFIDAFSFEGAHWPRYFKYVLCKYEDKYNVLLYYKDIIATVTNNLQAQSIQDVDLLQAFNQCVAEHFDLEREDIVMNAFLKKMFNYFNEKIIVFWKDVNANNHLAPK